MKKLLHMNKFNISSKNLKAEYPYLKQTIKKRINRTEINVYRILDILNYNVNSDLCPVINQILTFVKPTNKKDGNYERLHQKCLSSEVSVPKN